MTSNSNFFNSNFPDPNWPTSAPNTQTSKFNEIFAINPDGSVSGTKNDTMKQVLSGTYASTFTKYCIAAYLNARINTSSFPIDADQAIALWNWSKAGRLRPSWIPTAWVTADAEAWLKTQMA